MNRRPPPESNTAVGLVSSLSVALTSWMCRESSQRPGLSSRNTSSSETSTQRGAAHGSDLAILATLSLRAGHPSVVCDGLAYGLQRMHVHGGGMSDTDNAVLCDEHPE